MISGLIHYLHVAENQFTGGTPIYNIVLHSLIEAKEVSYMYFIYPLIKIFHYLISIVTTCWFVI